MKAAGADVRAYYGEEEFEVKGDDAFRAPDGIMIRKGGRALIPTGIRVAIPDGYEMQVRPRSGLALKKGITVLNTPGTVDGDYRGEVGVILINKSNAGFLVKEGERIAQLVISPVVQAEWKQVKELPTTERGEGGFGSTGKK